ncbi:MAG: phage tail tape measure protein [Proteobacteria bacterium]|nr:phage tail tape measure protein [Pseudomonadota bacterium]
MSSSMMMLGVTIKLFDQMSGGLRGIVTRVEGLRGQIGALADKANALGRGALGSGLIAGGTLMKTVSAFAELEDASTRLKSVMMGRDGTAGAFDQVNALAVRLGDQLPGTTADFLNMMAALKAQGISDDSILGGVGEAAAKMAVLLKKPPEEMAVFSAKLKTALGIADGDMLAFMDTIQRTYFMGVDATEMMYAFARSGGALKTIKQQGLEAGKSLAPLFAMWVKGGMSGETVGTGFASITNSLLDRQKIGKGNALLQAMGLGPLKFTDKKGNFAGIENMIAQFDKLKSLDATKLNAVLKEIFGGGQDQSMVATLVTNGVEGYRKQVAAMEAQADLQKRVGAVLGTLTNVWEAASGTFTNLLAGFGEAMSDDLKAMVEWFGRASEAIKNFVKENPTLALWLGRIALALTGIAIVGGGLLLVVGVVGKIAAGFMTLGPAVLFAVSAFSKLMLVARVIAAIFLANPITLAIFAIVAGLVLAAKLIYDNWEPIKGFFIDLWDDIKSAFASTIDWITGKMQEMADLLPKISNLVPDWMKKSPSATVNFANASPTVFGPGGQNTRVGGDIRISVDQDGRVSSVSGSTDNPAVPFNFDTGMSMLYP